MPKLYILLNTDNRENDFVSSELKKLTELKSVNEFIKGEDYNFILKTNDLPDYKDDKNYINNFIKSIKSIEHVTNTITMLI